MAPIQLALPLQVHPKTSVREQDELASLLQLPIVVSFDDSAIFQHATSLITGRHRQPW